MSKYRHADKPDANTAHIVSRLREVPGVKVWYGRPFDLWVGYRRRFTCLEVKREAARPRKDQQAQRDLLAEMREAGLPVYTVRNFEQALDAIQSTAMGRVWPTEIAE